MATRSIIAVPHGDGWKGRYAHWDGYPDWMGQALWRIVQRDGAEAAANVLTNQNFYWSNVDPTQTGLGDWQDDGRFAFVNGYGVAGTSAQAKDEWIYSTDFDYWGTEYVYVICADSLMIGEISGGLEQATVNWIGNFRFSDAEPVWAHLTGDAPATV
jgi:hypothetical protein